MKLDYQKLYGKSNKTGLLFCQSLLDILRTTIYNGQYPRPRNSRPAWVCPCVSSTSWLREIMALDVLKNIRAVLAEAFSSFWKNDDPSTASSLAFSATLALIPVLFLLTILIGAIIGSSRGAMATMQELLVQVVPAYSQDILREVRSIASHRGTIGLLNMLVLLWSMTPLVGGMRKSLGIVFRKKKTHPFLLNMLFDIAMGVLFLMGLAAVAVSGLVVTVAGRESDLHPFFKYLQGVVPFLFITAVIVLLYKVFSDRRRSINLVIGAVAASLLWFAMRPVFHLFLLYNPGYGFAFGSFKSLFVVIIWIYCSFIVFLAGAEIAASLGRDDTTFIKKLMEGRTNVPSGIIRKYVKRYEKESVIFEEGDRGTEIYSVLKGRVALRKDGKEIGKVDEGQFFGEMSFLLSTPRTTTAVAIDDVDLVEIDDDEIGSLMNEYPDFIVRMLREAAQRIREGNKLID